MKALFFVILQVTLASGVLYGYYHLMLRNKKFHQYNRFYLIASIIISALVPFINIPVYFAESEMQASVVLQTLQTISTDGFEYETTTTLLTSPEIHTAFSWNFVLYLFYGAVALILLIRILISLRKITAIIRNYPGEELNGVRFINTVEPGTPYSFFRWLFWNRTIELRSEKGEQIFRHEIYHIQQKHSVDIVFMELMTLVFWINPFFHLMKKEVKAIHEFLADEFAAHESEEWEYAELLLMQALNTQQHLVNPFFHNQIKRRIAMITNPQKTSHQYLRKLLVLPVIALVLILFAFKFKHQPADPSTKTDEPITIVIDAGQGGIDRGAKNKDGKYTEAAVTLQIAKEIQRLRTEDNVRVRMTRQGDNPGYKSRIVEEQKVLGRDTVPPTRRLGNIKNDSLSKSLIVIDGNVFENLKWSDLEKKVKPEDIESINVWKGETAIERYGDKGKFGVIEIITKKKSQVKDNDGKPENIQPANDNIIFEKVEIEPSFPGGETAWKKILETTLNTSIPAQNHAPPGEYTVYIQFIVHTDGSISDIKALTNHGFGMEQEAKRAIENSPRWNPAIQNGRPVNAYKKQRLDFVVGTDKIRKTTMIEKWASEIVLVAMYPPIESLRRVRPTLITPG